MANSARTTAAGILRLVTVAGLAVDAYVHFDLASQFDLTSSGITQGLLFRIEGAAAVLTALIVLMFGRRRWAAVPALLVAASALGAILLYRYVDVGQLGPLPDMYDPAWYPEKALAAVAEAVATVTAAMLALRRVQAPKKPAHLKLEQ
jgi:hypothetical protein